MNMHSVIRHRTLFCRLNLRFRVKNRVNEFLVIDKLLADLSQYGEILYAKSNEKFIKNSPIPLKIDLALASPELVKLTKVVTNMRGYSLRDLKEPDYSRLCAPVTMERKPKLDEVWKQLEARWDSAAPIRPVRLLGEPFVFSRQKPTTFRTLNGNVTQIRDSASLFDWKFVPIPEDKSNALRAHARFMDIQGPDDLVLINPCVFANLSELPNEMNYWNRISDRKLSKSNKEALNTLFHGFEGF